MTVKSATAIAYRRLLTVRGESMTYRRGGDEVSISIIPARDEFPRETFESITAEEEMQDFLVRQTDLVLDSENVEPEPGDQIDWPGFGTFEVHRPGGSEPAARPEGSHQFFWRIHTIQV